MIDEERLTRSELHSLEIENFLKSDLKVYPLCLYGREIKALEKKYPILITKVKKHGSLCECLAYKQKE